jgi:hypothetical protein
MYMRRVQPHIRAVLYTVNGALQGTAVQHYAVKMVSVRESDWSDPVKRPAVRNGTVQQPASSGCHRTPHGGRSAQRCLAVRGITTAAWQTTANNGMACGTVPQKPCSRASSQLEVCMAWLAFLLAPRPNRCSSLPAGGRMSNNAARHRTAALWQHHRRGSARTDGQPNMLTGAGWQDRRTT